jgi:hypothetical protein
LVRLLFSTDRREWVGGRFQGTGLSVEAEELLGPDVADSLVNEPGVMAT